MDVLPVRVTLQKRGLHCQPQTRVSNRTLLTFAGKITPGLHKCVQHVWAGQERFWHWRRVKEPLKNSQERRELMHVTHMLYIKGHLPLLPSLTMGLQAAAPKPTPPGQKNAVFK